MQRLKAKILRVLSLFFLPLIEGSVPKGRGGLKTMPTIFNKGSEKAKRRALRKSMPEAEIILWSKLKGRQLAGYKFRRQYSVGPYVVDFYCAQKKLAIELDGDSHFVPGAQERDRKRQKWIETFGLRFLRFTNNEVRTNLYGVLTAIEEALKEGS